MLTPVTFLQTARRQSACGWLHNRRRHRARRLSNWKATCLMSSSEGDILYVAILEGGRLVRESLGLYEAGKNAGESEDEYLERLSRVSRRELASEPGPLLFATRGDAVHRRFLPLLEDLGEVGGYAWGVAFLAHQFDGLSSSERQKSTSSFYPFLQVWAYLHPPALGRGDLTQPGLMVWQPYLGEGSKGQPWLVQAYPYFGRSVWLHALNLVLPLNLFLTQRSIGLRQSVVEFPVRDRFCRPGRSFRGLHDTTDWHERAREQIENWERKGKAVKSDATTDNAYLQAYALNELENVRGARASGASSSRTGEGTPSLLEARLAGPVLRAEEAQWHLEERERDLQLTTEHALELQGERDRLRGEAQATQSERDQLRIRAEAAEARVAKMTRELATLRVQRLPRDQEEVTRLRAELLSQQTVARSLQQIVTDIGRSRSQSRSAASISRATGASV
ncbi:hypothetical protein Taro_001549 [Colocasia esculenta]|uniref:Uncharacterized protein n=1 Tax=Colocasia esculenta TaxID=4460 RepID=A0A843TDZ3_COLES|nr:hypothetical protein [Colocasia esculenta]